MQKMTQIDIIKSLAIIAVIIHHAIGGGLLVETWATYHIWQAVPVFIIISAFLGTKSFLRRDYGSVKQMYGVKTIARRLDRILIPFVLIFVIEVLFAIYWLNREYGFGELVDGFLKGGWGFGGYFIPLMVQQIFILPIMYLLAKRNPNMMLWVMFFISIALEALTVYTGTPDSLYRLLYIRFIFAGALGVWLAFTNGKNKGWLKIGVIVSVLYILAVIYFNFELPFIHPSWNTQHVFSYFYPLILIIAGIKYFPKQESNVFTSFFSLLGKASYHIFLIQMVFFWLISRVSHYKNMIIFDKMITSLIFCIAAGLMFYYIENYVRSLIKRRPTQ